eukprot:TRINITY_DN24017_c0_g1_i3.p1 TRINITY_DN24017_c0_g1~~TRINITY_DN24017_c0_g1_i3.p1  ORF type:complete len:530 (+),score=153.88 TRINITY_DN24017_c0_g1_i3:629-2218(+)
MNTDRSVKSMSKTVSDLEAGLRKLRAEQDEDAGALKRLEALMEQQITARLGGLDFHRLDRHVRDLLRRQSEDDAQLVDVASKLEQMRSEVDGFSRELNHLRKEITKVQQESTSADEELEVSLDRLQMSLEQFSQGITTRLSGIDGSIEDHSGQLKTKDLELREFMKDLTGNRSKMLDVLEEELPKLEKRFSESILAQQTAWREATAQLAGQIEDKVAAGKLEAEHSIFHLENEVTKRIQSYAARMEALVAGAMQSRDASGALQELRPMVSKMLGERQAMQVALRSLQQIFGEHAIDIQYLYTHADWTKKVVEQLQDRSFIGMPPKAAQGAPGEAASRLPLPRPPSPLKYRRKELDPMPKDLLTLGAMTWEDPSKLTALKAIAFAEEVEDSSAGKTMDAEASRRQSQENAVLAAGWKSAKPATGGSPPKLAIKAKARPTSAALQGARPGTATALRHQHSQQQQQQPVRSMQQSPMAEQAEAGVSQDSMLQLPSVASPCGDSARGNTPGKGLHFGQSSPESALSALSGGGN